MPEENVHDLFGYPKEYTFKCRGNYIAGLGIDLQSAILDNVITDDGLIKEIKKFCSHRFGYQDGKFTTQGEIDIMNSILDNTISYLQSGK